MSYINNNNKKKNKNKNRRQKKIKNNNVLVAVKEEEKIVIIKKPRAIVEKPRAIVEKPRAIVEKPRAIVEKPRAIVEKPKVIIEEEKVIIEEEKVIEQPIVITEDVKLIIKDNFINSVEYRYICRKIDDDKVKVMDILSNKLITENIRDELLQYFEIEFEDFRNKVEYNLFHKKSTEKKSTGKYMINYENKMNNLITSFETIIKKYTVV